jgi:iron(III) transport system permease protein
VLAVGVFILLAWLDKIIMASAKSWLHLEPGLLLTGTLATMLLGYLVRFLAVAYNPIDSAIQRITPSVDEAARSLGSSGIKLLRRVHLPILRGGLLTAAMLVFVDVMKEMPLTLMTRPFGWDTLSIRIFEMTSEGEWERAALPAVALVLTGLIPIMVLTKQAGKTGQ